MYHINEYKKELFDIHKENIEILKSSIKYDCVYLFEILETITGENKKRF